MHYVTQGVSPGQTTLLPGLDNVDGLLSLPQTIFSLHRKKTEQQ